MKFSVLFNPSAFRREVGKQAQPILSETAIDIRIEIIRLFGGVKTGRAYRRPKPLRGTYRASKAGEAPAIRTATLLRSISTTPTMRPLSATLLIGAPYAGILEDPKKLNRPFVAPAVKAVTERFNRGASSRF